MRQISMHILCMQLSEAYGETRFLLLVTLLHRLQLAAVVVVAVVDAVAVVAVAADVAVAAAEVD